MAGKMTFPNPNDRTNITFITSDVLSTQFPAAYSHVFNVLEANGTITEENKPSVQGFNATVKNGEIVKFFEIVWSNDNVTEL